VLMPMRVIDPEEAGESQAETVQKDTVPAKQESAAAPVEEPAQVSAEPAVEPEKTDEVETAVPQGGDEPIKTDRNDKTRRRAKTMPKENGNTEPTALDRVLVACEAAKGKVTEAGSALTELAKSIKEATREGKAQASDLEKARTTLQKLQAITL